MQDGSSSTDGVIFRVAINGATRWQQTMQANQWIPGITDLSPWAGQTILVELITDSIGFNAFDGALWADLVLRDSGFTDNLLTSTLTIIKRVHITELRDRINALRARAGLGAYPWSDPSLVAGVTQVRAEHIVDLRTALVQAYGAMSIPAPAFTDPAFGPGLTISATHVAELRAAVLAIE